MLAYVFVLFAVAVRLLIPYLQAHPWHFTPVAACLLFFGARGSRRQFWIPVALLAASDIVLNRIHGYPFTPDQLVSWAWYAAVVFLGTRLRGDSKPVWVLGAAVASSVSFFLLSNFSVWAYWNMYPKNLGGLVTCYAMGLPFFQREIVGDVLFTSAMFSVPILLKLTASLWQGSGRAAA